MWVGLISMRKISHVIIAGSAGSSVGLAFFGNSFSWAIFCIASIGSTMIPDKLEYIVRDVRWVKHRTLTHWLGGWVGLVVGWMWFCEKNGIDGALASGVAGFLVGACIHLICDMSTPMGVPVFLPLSKWRVSLGIVRSGVSELMAVILSLLVSYLWFLSYCGF